VTGWLDKIAFPGATEWIDIALVAAALYWAMLLVKGSRAEKMLWGLGVVVFAYFFSGRFELLTLHWLLSNFLGSIIIIIIVIFQQDIRRALVQMGRAVTTNRAASMEYLEELVDAVKTLSSKKTGALIAIEREVETGDVISGGVELGGEVSKELLLTVFMPASPLHDGAVIVKNGRLAKAGCILPLTEKELPKSMGTRHRAAIGLSEDTDAVIIVVSEETGDITLVAQDSVEHGLSPEELHAKIKGLISAEAFATGGMFTSNGSRP